MSASVFDFDLHEDIRSVRGAIDSQAWVLNNTHNAGTQMFEEMRKAAREDRDHGVAALDRIEEHLRECS